MSSFFFGRATELERLRAIASDSVVVIYGLPGIGKTELAFRCAGELLATPAWHGVPLTRVIVDPEMAPNFHNYLLARLTGHGDLNPLDRLLDLLARDRHVLVIDDAHHAPVAVAALIDGIGRVRAAGRLIVTSRVELPFSTTPITVRIGPLEPAAARALVGHMAERLGVHVDDVDALVAQGRGSPLVLHHLVAGRGRGTGGDPIQATIAVLDSEAQRALVQLAAISGCSESRLAASQLVDDRTLTTLTEHLLVECGPDRVSVHGLVRDLVMKEADPQLVADSRRTVAGVLWDEFEQRHRPLLAVNSICLGLTLGDVDQAFARLRAASRTIASAGLDLLLLPILEGFADRGHADAALVVARIYLRMSRIDDAASLLDRLPAAQQSPRVLTMRATIAERVGDLPLAIRAFAEAITRTTSTRVWCLLGMRLAAVRAMAGDDAGAEAMLREIETTCPELGDIDLARLWWVRGIIDALHQDWPSVLAAVGKGRRAATRAGARDLDYLLLLLELLAASENADVERCEQIANEVGRAQPSQPVRERMTDLYLGVSQLTRGQVDASIVTLQRAYAELGRQRDTLLASLAGHYLGRALLIRGDADAAVEVLAAVANVAVACGQVHLVGPGNAYLARALMSTGRDEEARRLAEPLVANPCLQVSAEASAVLAYVAAFAGDIGGARRQIAVALARAGDREPLRSNLILDHAQLEMLGGDPDRMRTAALTVLDDHVRRSRPYARGRALIALATAELAVGNMPSAIDALAECETVALSHGMRNLRDRVTLLRGATAQARGSVLDRVPAEHRNGYLGLLRVLGLRSETVIVSSREGLVHTDADHVAAIALEHDILVDVSTGTLIGRGGQRVKGRDTAATILSRLADSAEPLSAERLYQLVWGGREYHPLRHRNTLYIALNRTRKVLREIGEEREVIQHDGLGWSIAPEIDVAVVRRDPRVTTSGVVELT